MCPNTLVCLSKERKNLHALNLFLCRQRMAGLLIWFSVSIFYLGSNSCLFKIMQTEEVNCIQKKVQEGRAVRRWTPKTEYVIPEKVLWKIPSLYHYREGSLLKVQNSGPHLRYFDSVRDLSVCIFNKHPMWDDSGPPCTLQYVSLKHCLS